MKDKTLLVLIPGFPENEEDTTCVTFPQSFVRHLKRLNPSMHIIVLAFQYPFSRSVYPWHNVEVHSFNGQNQGNWRRLMLWRTVRKQIGVIMRNHEVGGILSFWMGECAFVGRAAAKKYGVPFYCWLMGQDARKRNKYVRLARPAAASLIALSDFLQREFYRNYRIHPQHVIGPGIDAAMFSQPLLSRPIDLMGAGSLIPLKRYDRLVDVVAKLARTNKHIKAMICGDGPEREKLMTMIVENGLKDNIELTGELAHRDVLRLMQATKVFVHPSSYEGYGMVCAEALYAGAQVVGFCQPMDELPEHMHIVATPAEMKEKIEKLLNGMAPDHEPVLTCPIETTCEKVLALYS